MFRRAADHGVKSTSASSPEIWGLARPTIVNEHDQANAEQGTASEQIADGSDDNITASTRSAVPRIE